MVVTVVAPPCSRHCRATLLTLSSPLRGWMRGIKKADVTEHPEVFGHVGLLANGPPDLAGLPFI